MLEIILIGFAVVIAAFAFVTWLDNYLNRNDEFISVKDWHDFQNSMKKGNK